jgi:hypothetical protein
MEIESCPKIRIYAPAASALLTNKQTRMVQRGVFYWQPIDNSKQWNLISTKWNLRRHEKNKHATGALTALE